MQSSKLDYSRFVALKAVFPIALLLLAACGELPSKQVSQDPAIPEDEYQPAGNSAPIPGQFIVAFTNFQENHTIHAANWLSESINRTAAITDQIGVEGANAEIIYLGEAQLYPTATTDMSGWFFLGQKMAWGMPLFSLDKLSSPSVLLAKVEFKDDGKSTLDSWLKDGKIQFFEPDTVSELHQDNPSPTENVFQKLGREYSELTDTHWWFDRMRLPAAFNHLGTPNGPGAAQAEAAIEASPPVIAVFDSGVDYQHPALAKRMWVNPSPGSAGCTDDLHGCDTTKPKKGKLGVGDVHPFGISGPGQTCPSGLSNCSHGTHVAGLIASDHAWTDEAGNIAGGVCPVCRIMAVKVVSKTIGGSGIVDSSLIAGLQYVQRFRKEKGTKVRILNCSFGKFSRSRAIALILRSLRYDGPGTLVIAAAGNEDTLAMEYPAAYPDVIAVGAVDQQLRKTVYSNFGRWVDIVAPGHMLVSTVPGNGLEAKPGTSMAAPLVAGVAGLMLAQQPDISFGELRRWLLESADPGIYDPAIDNGYNFNYYYPKIKGESARLPLLGNGLINAENAILRKNTGELPIYNKLDRVEPGCATLGLAANGTASSHADYQINVLIFLLAPLIIIALAALRSTGLTHQNRED